MVCDRSAVDVRECGQKSVSLRDPRLPSSTASRSEVSFRSCVPPGPIRDRPLTPTIPWGSMHAIDRKPVLDGSRRSRSAPPEPHPQTPADPGGVAESDRACVESNAAAIQSLKAPVLGGLPSDDVGRLPDELGIKSSEKRFEGIDGCDSLPQWRTLFLS
jgi:hypothetical protein